MPPDLLRWRNPLTSSATDLEAVPLSDTDLDVVASAAGPMPPTTDEADTWESREISLYQEFAVRVEELSARYTGQTLLPSAIEGIHLHLVSLITDLEIRGLRPSRVDDIRRQVRDGFKINGYTIGEWRQIHHTDSRSMQASFSRASRGYK